MFLKQKTEQWKAYKRGVVHCTFNPDGPGVVRIHLIPPKFRIFTNPNYIVILNGYYILPLGYAWAELLTFFMDEINKFDGKSLSHGDVVEAKKAAVCSASELFSTEDLNSLYTDLTYILKVFYRICRGENVNAEFGDLSMRKYASHMSAPHRMDLMVSANVTKDGKWNCNQKCRFCYAAGEPMSAVGEMSTVEWKKTIDTLKVAGVPMLTFTGGEPTLRKDLIELIDYSRWFVTRLNTNGLLLTEELCGRLRKASLDSLQITLYSADSATHDRLVELDGGFERTAQGIRNALKAGLDVSVNTPLCRDNSDYLATLNFLRGLGVRFFTFSGLICSGSAHDKCESNDLSRDELTEIAEKAWKFCAENDSEITFTSPGLIPSEKLEEIGYAPSHCGACLSNMAIAPDGEVIPCQSWLSGKTKLGNILTTEWKKIWNAPTCRKLRQMKEETAKQCPFRNDKERFENE